LLAYLMRWNPDRAMPLVAQEKSTGFSMRLLQGMSSAYQWRSEPYPPVVRAYLRGVVEKDNDSVAISAAYQLERRGAPEDATVLRERLAAFEAEWQPKAELLHNQPADQAVRDALNLERALIAALRQQALKPSPQELARLKAQCLGEFCAKLSIGAIPPEPPGWGLPWPTLNDYR